MELIVLPPIDNVKLTTKSKRNLIESLKMTKRSPSTRRAYTGDIDNFFIHQTGRKLEGDDLLRHAEAFLALEQWDMSIELNQWKAHMFDLGLSEATINRRMCSMRALINHAYITGYCKNPGRDLVQSEKVKAYRDTRGPSVAVVKQLFELPNKVYARGSVAALRDSAILRLMAECGLRRAEVVRLMVDDYQPAERRIMILGKGRGTNQEPMTISDRAMNALDAYLNRAGHGTGPLFRSLDHKMDKAAGLTSNGLYTITTRYGRMLGINLNPHKLRHSAITAALEVTSGDIGKAMRFSRHSDPKTVMIYNDNRENWQGDITGKLSDVYGD